MRTSIRPWASLLVLLAFTTSTVAIAPRSFADDSTKQGDKVSKVDDSVNKSDDEKSDRPWWKRWLSGAGRGAKKTGEGALHGAVWVGKQSLNGAVWLGKQGGKGLVWAGKKSWKGIKKFFGWFGIGKKRDAENRTTDEKIPAIVQNQNKVLPATAPSNPPTPPVHPQGDNEDSDSSDEDSLESISAA